MGPGLETVLAQILGEALGLPAARFDVRHADTAAVESGVGTYGSRGTVTAGNAAAARRRQAHRRGAQRAAARLGVAEAEVHLRAAGVLQAGGRRVTLAELAAERRLAAGASFEVPKVTYAGCACAVVLDVDPETGVLAPAPGRRRRRRRPRGEPGAGRRPARGRRGLRHRQHAAREPRLRRRRPAPVRHADGLRAARCATDVPAVDGFYQEVRAKTNPLGLRGLGECGNPGLGARHRQRRVRRAGPARPRAHRAADHPGRASSPRPRPRTR